MGEALCLLLASQQPARLIITGRSLDKAGASAKAIKDAHPKLEVIILKLDLASLESVRQAAEEVNRYDGAIDVLINNAGVMNIPERQLSKDGRYLALVCCSFLPRRKRPYPITMKGIEHWLTLPFPRI